MVRYPAETSKGVPVFPVRRFCLFPVRDISGNRVSGIIDGERCHKPSHTENSLVNVLIFIKVMHLMSRIFRTEDLRTLDLF